MPVRLLARRHEPILLRKYLLEAGVDRAELQDRSPFSAPRNEICRARPRHLRFGAMRALTLRELSRRYVERGRPLPVALERMLLEDPRPGARALLALVNRRRRAHRAEGQRLRWISRHERALWQRGVELVAGVDEAGMSPLAGPVAAGAVILPVGWRTVGVDDSKKLDARQRERLAAIIRKDAIAWAVAFVEPAEIDRINIYWAGLLAMRRAIETLSIAPQHLLIDGRRLKEIEIPQTRVVHGDARCVTIAAASILAKTARDAHMLELDALYPGYGFARHKGYPVRAHQLALRRLGPCPEHRRSFEPVRLALSR